MDGEFEEKIKQIGSLFGLEGIPDGLGEMIESMAGSLGKNGDDIASSADASSEESSCADVDPEASPCVAHTSSSGTGDTIIPGLKTEDMVALLGKCKNFSEAGGDKRVRLLRALEPFLQESKKAKIGNCIRILSLAQLVRTIG